MSLDTIQLPASIIQSLYSGLLYDLGTDKLIKENTTDEDISFLGNNLKKVMILVDSTSSIYLPDDELNFLLGILAACQLNMADIALINIAKNKQVTYQAISEKLGAEKIILFGANSSELQLSLQFPYYQVQQFNNQTYLASVGLQTLMTDKAEKIKLWSCLKKIFSV